MGRGHGNLADEWPPLRTLTDIALRHWNVRLTCPTCKHVRVLSGPGLWWLFHCKHWSDEVDSAKTHLYCSPCRLSERPRTVPLFEKTRDPPTGPRLQDPSDYEWKKLIARYRS